MQESKTHIHTTSPLYLPSSWISCLPKHPRNAITQFTAILLIYQLYTFLGSRHTHKPNTDSATFLQDTWGKQESQKESEIRKSPTIFTLKDRYIRSILHWRALQTTCLCLPCVSGVPWIILWGFWIRLKIHKDTGNVKGTKGCFHFQSLLTFDSYQVKFLLQKLNMNRTSFIS